MVRMMFRLDLSMDPCELPSQPRRGKTLRYGPPGKNQSQNHLRALRMSHPQEYIRRMNCPFLGHRMRYKMHYSDEGCKGLFLLSGFDVVRQSLDALSDLTPVRSVAGFKLSAPDRHLSWAMSGQ